MRIVCDSRTSLLDTIRHQLGLYGTHAGCEHGVCGACTVLLGNQPVRSCLVLTQQCEGQSISTIEGVASQDRLSDLQYAFSRHHALQCGFCTAGILITAEDLLRRLPNPSESEVREAISGHLCRCTGYVGIVNAILEVAKMRSTQALKGEGGHV